MGFGDWRDFFEAAAGAAAALAGLIFVALSVNIAEVLKFEHLPDRAAATLGALMLILVVSLATLAPQPRLALGVEVLILAAAVWWLQLRSGMASLRSGRTYQRPRLESATELITGQLQTLPFFVGGAMLATGMGGGLYWLAGGALTVFIFSAINAWVLLIEILR